VNSAIECACGKALRHEGRCKGYAMTTEQRGALSLAALGKKKSASHRLNISKAKTGVKRKPFSLAARRKMSEAHLGIPKHRSHPDFAEFKAKSLPVRRAVSRLLTAFRHPIRLDAIAANGSSERIEFLLGFAREPDPCEALIQKEERELERKYWIWRTRKAA
jgi:hypothetical protein